MGTKMKKPTGTTYALRSLLREELNEIDARREAIFAVIRGLDAACQHTDLLPATSNVFQRCRECQELVPNSEWIGADQ